MYNERDLVLAYKYIEIQSHIGRHDIMIRSKDITYKYS